MNQILLKESWGHMKVSLSPTLTVTLCLQEFIILCTRFLWLQVCMYMILAHTHQVKRKTTAHTTTAHACVSHRGWKCTYWILCTPSIVHATTVCLLDNADAASSRKKLAPRKNVASPKFLAIFPTRSYSWVRSHYYRMFNAFSVRACTCILTLLNGATRGSYLIQWSDAVYFRTPP